jgi:hypothetical protein
MPRQWPGVNGNYLDFGNTLSLAGNTFSISIWVWLTAASGVIVTNRNTGNQDGTFWIRHNGSVWEFMVKPEGSTLTQVCTGTSTPQVGRWTHLAARQDNVTGVTALWVNGVKEATSGLRNTSSGQSIRVGQYINAAGNASMIASHFAMWLYALKDSDVWRLSQGALPSEIVSGRLGIWAPFATGGNARDRSVRQNDGVQTGSVPPVRDPQAVDIAYGGYPWLPSAPPRDYPPGSIPAVHIASTTQAFQPYLIPGYPAFPDFIAATTALFTPTVSKSTVPPFIGPIATLFTPTVRRSSITLQERIEGTQVFEPYLARTLVNVVLPTIMGVAQEGLQLEASPGVWSGTEPITYAYQWRRCDAGGGACVDISGETGYTYIVRPADVGGTLRIRVTASNG